MFLTKLEVVDFESNNISAITEIDYLSILSNLKLLIFLNNPITDHEKYRELVMENVPGLQLLDDEMQNSGLKKEIEKSQGQGMGQGHGQTHRQRINSSKILKNQLKDFEKICPQDTSISGLLHASSPKRPQTAMATPKVSSSNLNSGYSQLTTGEIMVGSAARSLRSRQVGKQAKDSDTNILTISSSGTNTDDLNYIRPKIDSTKDLEMQKRRFEEKYGQHRDKNRRPATSYDNRTKSRDFSSYHQGDRDQKNPNFDVEKELANAADETDALLKELQEWRLQYSNDLEKINNKYPDPKKNELYNSLEKQVVRPIPPSNEKPPRTPKSSSKISAHHAAAEPHYDRLSSPPSNSSGSAGSGDPTGTQIVHNRNASLPTGPAPKSPDNHKRISNARMRQFQRRSNQHKKQVRDRSLTIEQPMVSHGGSATTSPQQLSANL